MLTEEERFWKKVTKTDTCWLWTAGQAGPYGAFYPTGARQAIGAHVWSYIKHKGPVPTGLVVDHQCEVKLCVNPAHLKAMTHRENILKGTGLAAQQAQQTHCKRGHSLHDAYLLSRNRRDCRTCRKLRNERRTFEYRKQHG